VSDNYGAVQASQAIKQIDWDDLPAIMDLSDLAKFFGVGYRRALELCHIKGFPSMKIGRGWRINRDGLRRWIDRQTSAA
jgi:excisionase family DNA binding protein